MGFRQFCIVQTTAVVLWCLSAAPASASLVLSGLANFSTDASGAFQNFQFWNTQGGDYFFNLYVTQPNSGINGEFLNASSDGPTTGLNFALTPGTYQFHFFGQPGLDFGHFGLNLFFEGNNTNPGISVFAPTDLPVSPPFPSFVVNSNSSTVTLAGTPVSAAGSLSYTSGLTRVTLTDYRWSAPSVYNVDRVSPYASQPDGSSDFAGSFTLQVATVPEPSGVLLLSSSTLGLIGLGLRKVQSQRKRPI